jgi:hypothetical protein
MTNYKSSTELKSLKTQIVKLTAESEVMGKEVSEKQAELAKIRNKLNAIQTQYNTLLEEQTEKEPIVSEHAIIRYLERVKGIEIDPIVTEIMDANTKAAIKFMKNGKINRDTYTIVIRNSVVVSIT